MSKPSFLFTSSTFGPLKHVVQIKVALTAVRISFTPLHLLCTHFRQPVHWIEFLPTPFLHTAHGHLLGSSSATLPSPAIITFVFPTFTFNPFASMPSFHLSILSRNSPIFFAINTRSSAHKSSHGSPTFTSKLSLSPLSHLIKVFAPSYIVITVRTSHSSTPAFLNAHLTTSRGTQSNAFSKSTNA